MHKRLTGCNPPRWIPLQAPLDQVQKQFILTDEGRTDGLTPRTVDFAAGLLGLQLAAVVEELAAFGAVDEGLGWVAEELDEHTHLLVLVLAGEDGLAGEQLAEDAAKGPDVDGLGVLDTEDDLGSAIKATLDVSVENLVSTAAATQVYYFDSGFILLAE